MGGGTSEQAHGASNVVFLNPRNVYFATWSCIVMICTLFCIYTSIQKVFCKRKKMAFA